MLALVFATGGLVAGLGGLFLGFRRDRRDTDAAETAQSAAETAQSEHLTALIVAQTENLLRGNEASVGELRERATELLDELRTCREERDGLRDRVDELEVEVERLRNAVAGIERANGA